MNTFTKIDIPPDRQVYPQLLNTSEKLKRKFRYTFEGKDAEGNVVFPMCFVKISHRPSFPYVGTAEGLVPIPGSIELTQMFFAYDDPKQAEVDWNKYYPSGLNVVSGVLKTLDGCGEPMESWEFNGVKMKVRVNQDEDGIVAEWSVDYLSCEHKVIQEFLPYLGGERTTLATFTEKWGKDKDLKEKYGRDNPE